MDSIDLEDTALKLILVSTEQEMLALKILTVKWEIPGYDMRFGKGQAINCQSDNGIGCLVVYLECTVIDINYPDMNIKCINIADRIKITQFCQIPTWKLTSKVPAD